jgi:histidine ammonia-lyase
VQDALSLRTLPQVHGALLDQLAYAREQLETELNAASDNPLVSVEEDRLISNGNFSPMTLALAFESLRLALAHVGAICERRLHKLLAIRHRIQSRRDPLERLGRVPNLIVNAAAGLLARLKHLAHPVTLSTTSLNCDVEDHASLAPQSVTLTGEAVALLQQLVGIELLLASDTLEILQCDGPILLGQGTQRAFVQAQTAIQTSDSMPAALDAVLRTFSERSR